MKLLCVAAPATPSSLPTAAGITSFPSALLAAGKWAIGINPSPQMRQDIDDMFEFPFRGPYHAMGVKTHVSKAISSYKKT